MQKMKVIIVGAGGHGKVVADALLKENKFDLVGFADDNILTNTLIYEKFGVICKTNELKKHADGFILAIGNNKIRAEKYLQLKNQMNPVSIVHPFSSVATNVIVGNGTVILAGVAINASVTIGENCIVNTNSLIDHDCRIMDHCHIGQRSLIGSGNILESFHHVIQNENIPSAYQ